MHRRNLDAVKINTETVSICVFPKRKKTFLVELCFDGVMGIQDKGTLSSKTLIFKL